MIHYQLLEVRLGVYFVAAWQLEIGRSDLNKTFLI